MPPAPGHPAARPLPAAAHRLDVHGVILAALLAWVVLGAVGQLHLALRDTLVNSVDLLFDDAYYYLGVAWHLAQGHGSKFTQPLATNGYHPLWLLLLAGIAAVFDLSKQGLFCATLVLTAVVKCVGLVGFGRGEPDAWKRSAGRIAIFVAMVKFPFVFSVGLETTLFVVLIPWLLRRAGAPAWSARDALWVGAAMSFVFLARIDALALDVAVLALATATRRASPRRAALAAVPLLATAAVYAGVNALAFGTPLPVSGQAKAIGSHFAGNLGTALDYLVGLRWAALMLALALVARLTVARRLALPWFELAALGAALLACAGYYGAMSGWPIWPWYLYPNALLTVYATAAGGLGGAALVVAGTGAAGRIFKPVRLRTALAVVGATVVVNYLWGVIRADDTVRGHLVAHYLGREIRNPSQSSFNKENLKLLPWLDAHYPQGALIAMGDRAGGLGYWMSERHALIQTEGLVADKAFLRVLATGSLGAWLVAREVDLYVSDRPRVFAAAGVAGPVLGFVEPVQPRVTGGALNLLCFAERDRLQAVDYRWRDDPQQRHVFRVDQQVDCPPALRAEVGALKRRYDGIRGHSGLD